MRLAGAVARIALIAAGVSATSAAASIAVALAFVDNPCGETSLDVAAGLWIGAAVAGAISLLALAYGWWLGRLVGGQPFRRRLLGAFVLGLAGLGIWVVAFVVLVGASFTLFGC